VRYLQSVAAVVALFVLFSVAVPASGADYATKDEAVTLVKQAIARVAEVGIDKAKPEFMDHGGNSSTVTCISSSSTRKAYASSTGRIRSSSAKRISMQWM
jgi:hypothetical protein